MDSAAERGGILNSSTHMIEKLKYLITVACLIIFPLMIESPRPWHNVIGIGLLTILGIGWLIIRSRKEDNFSIPKFLPFILAFIILQVILLIITPVKTTGYHWIFYELFILFIFIFLLENSSNPSRRRFWENVLIAAALIYAAIDILYMLTWYSNWWDINNSLFPLPSLIKRSPGILIGHFNMQSSYLTLVTPLVLVRLLSVKKRSARIFWTEILLIILAANFLTYSRGGWLSLAGAILITVILFYQPLWTNFGTFPSRIKSSKLGKIWYAGIGLFALIILGVITAIAFILQSAPHGTLNARLDIYSYAIKWISTSPIWGQGTGSGPSLFALRSYAIGGDEIYNAHNTWLDITLETGILGLLLVIIALGIILWGYRSSWIKWQSDPIKHASLAAYAGVGTAFLIHSQLERLLWKTGYAIAIAIILALVSSLAAEKFFFILRKWKAIVILALILLVGSGGRVLSERNSLQYWDGRSAAAEWDWSSARQKICSLADLNPDNAFYSFQCSLANAYFAKIYDDHNALEDAFNYQNRALKLDPNWYIHWANLSSYEWQLGEHETAINHMEKALEMAPNRTFLLVSLGWMLEQSGEKEQAFHFYQDAYCRNPGYRGTQLFHESSTFHDVVKIDCPKNDNRQGFVDRMWAGHQALADGDFVGAEKHYENAIPAAIQSGAPYAYLALVHDQAGQIDQSKRDLKTAFLIENNSSEINEIAGKIALGKGNLSEGYDHLYEAFLIRQNYTFSRLYYGFAYFETGLPSDTSPYIPYTMNIELRGLYEQLAAYLADQGEDQKSNQVLQWLKVTTIQ